MLAVLPRLMLLEEIPMWPPETAASLASLGLRPG